MAVDVPTRVGFGGVSAGVLTAILLAKVSDLTPLIWMPMAALSALAALWGFVPVLRHFVPFGLDEDDPEQGISDLRYSTGSARMPLIELRRMAISQGWPSDIDPRTAPKVWLTFMSGLRQAAIMGEISFFGRESRSDSDEIVLYEPLKPIEKVHWGGFKIDPISFLAARENIRIESRDTNVRSQALDSFRDLHVDREDATMWLASFRVPQEAVPAIGSPPAKAEIELAAIPRREDHDEPDTWVQDALMYVLNRKWPEPGDVIKDEQPVMAALDEMRVKAGSGRLLVWGQEYPNQLPVLIDRDFWTDHQFEYLTVIFEEPEKGKTERATIKAAYREFFALRVLRYQVEALWPSA